MSLLVGAVICIEMTFHSQLLIQALLGSLEVFLFELSFLEVAVNGWLVQRVSVDSFFFASDGWYKGSSNDSQEYSLLIGIPDLLISVLCIVIFLSHKASSTSI